MLMGSTRVIMWKRQTDLRLKQVTNLKNYLNIHMKSSQKKKLHLQITNNKKTENKWSKGL